MFGKKEESKESKVYQDMYEHNPLSYSHSNEVVTMHLERYHDLLAKLQEMINDEESLSELYEPVDVARRDITTPLVAKVSKEKAIEYIENRLQQLLQQRYLGNANIEFID